MSGPRTTDPSVTDDSASGYSIGSIWVNTTSDLSYVCLDASVGAAVWKQITAPLNNYLANAAPTASNDSSEGYSVGSHWIDTTNDNAYICMDASAGAAVWQQVVTDAPLNNFAATTDPTTANDDSEGYSVGSQWINTTADASFVCVDASTGAAVWKGTSSGNFYGFYAKGAERDITNGSRDITGWPTTVYNFGTGWDATTGIYTVPESGMYLISAGSALSLIGAVTNATHVTEVFVRVNGGLPGVVTTSPEGSSVSGTHTQVLSLTQGDEVLMYVFQNTGNTQRTNAFYTYFNVVKIDNTPGSGGGSGLLNNFSATANPTASNDSTQGYSIGSRWINTSADRSFDCLDSTSGSAIWRETGVSTTVSTTNILSTGIPPAKPTTVIKDEITLTDLGNNWAAVTIAYTHGTGDGSAGSGKYIIELPGSYQFDSSFYTFVTSASGGTISSNYSNLDLVIPTSGFLSRNGGIGFLVGIVPHNATRFSILDFSVQNSFVFVGAGDYGTQTADVCWNVRFTFKYA